MAHSSKRSQTAKEKALRAATAQIRGTTPWTPEELANAVRAGRREALAQAITWVESTLPEHQERNERLLALASPTVTSVRIGITGIPGAGKSTLIERFGQDAVAKGHRVAVLAIDPSSQRTGGALLGDKTRMSRLSLHPDSFVRPSPSSNTLGGVARATAEAIQLCEAAGFDLILVETVGVGQSETAVRQLVDVFVLLLIGGAGDDVQGIKRGVVEMADLVVVHKADGDHVAECRHTAAAYRQALHVLPSPPSGTDVRVVLASSMTGEGHAMLWDELHALQAAWRGSGWWDVQRNTQRRTSFETHARQLLVDAYMNHNKDLWNSLLSEVDSGNKGPFESARIWVRTVQSSNAP